MWKKKWFGSGNPTLPSKTLPTLQVFWPPLSRTDPFPLAKLYKHTHSSSASVRGHPVLTPTPIVWEHVSQSYIMPTVPVCVASPPLPPLCVRDLASHLAAVSCERENFTGLCAGMRSRESTTYHFSSFAALFIISLVYVPSQIICPLSHPSPPKSHVPHIVLDGEAGEGGCQLPLAMVIKTLKKLYFTPL